MLERAAALLPPHDSRPSRGRPYQLAGGSNPSRAVLNHSASHRSCVAPRCAKRFLSACCMHEHHRKRSRCSQWWARSPPCGEGAHLIIAASAAAQRGHPPCLGPGGAGLGSRWQREEKRGVEFLGIPKPMAVASLAAVAGVTATYHERISKFCLDQLWGSSSRSRSANRHRLRT